MYIIYCNVLIISDLNAEEKSQPIATVYSITEDKAQQGVTTYAEAVQGRD